jgi:hypothetical protein
MHTCPDCGKKFHKIDQLNGHVGGGHSRRMKGVWIAYYSDLSSVVPFRNEVDALRHAVEHSMLLRFLEFGTDLAS